MRLCTVAGCGKPYLATGLCSAHWQRRKIYGTPTEPRHYRSSNRLNDQGYRVFVRNKKVIRQHIVIAERALGKPLPMGAVVHHANAIRDDNRPENLVICPDSAYHALLHMRMRAQAAGVPLDWRKCHICGKYDAPESLRFAKVNGRTQSGYHLTCRAAQRNAQWRAKHPDAPLRGPRGPYKTGKP